jgi:hypothetical protein
MHDRAGDDDEGHFNNYDNDEDDDIDEISRLERLNMTLSANLGMLASAALLDGDDHDYDNHNGRFDNCEDKVFFDYDEERIREREAAAADLRTSARERMARSRAKKKEEKRAAERIREREAATAAAYLRRARNREHKARSRVKKKEEKIAAERIREREAATAAADLRRARNREHKARSRAKKKEATPSPSIQFLQQSTVPKEVKPHEDSFEGGIEGANEATHDEINEGVNEIESCCYSDYFSHEHCLTQIAKEIFDCLFCNQFRTPWSEGNGIVISGDSCYGNPIKINIHRPSYLRQNYGLNSNSAVMFNRDDYRACYGTGGGMKTLGIPKR